MCLTAQAETYFIFDCPGQVELYTNHERYACRHISQISIRGKVEWEWEWTRHKMTK